MNKLGLIAGGGQLPYEIAAFCRRANRPLFVVRLKGFADPEMAEFDGADSGLAEVGRTLKLLVQAGCASVCLAGLVKRPDFAALKPDLKGLTILPGAIAAARHGDDALLRYLLSLFEKEGLKVEGAHDVMGGLTLPPGALGRFKPSDAAMADAEKAMRIAAEIGRLDIGQGAVVCRGLVLAVEAQEGTDAMLARVADLPLAIRGLRGAPHGVLAKLPKPIQERRVDLPTLGVTTLEGVAAAGLCGVVGEAGALIVVDREAVAQAADRLGLFVWGAPPLEGHAP
jgi:DUF1009 family protein